MIVIFSALTLAFATIKFISILAKTLINVMSKKPQPFYSAVFPNETKCHETCEFYTHNYINYIPYSFDRSRPVIIEQHEQRKRKLADMLS